MKKICLSRSVRFRNYMRTKKRESIAMKRPITVTDNELLELQRLLSQQTFAKTELASTVTLQRSLPQPRLTPPGNAAL